MTDGDKHGTLLAPVGSHRAPILAISVLSAVLVSFGDVAYRLGTGHELFSVRQILLALTTIFTLLGFMAVIVRLALVPITSFRFQSASRQSWIALGCGTLIIGLQLFAMGWVAPGSIILNIAKITGILLGAACLTILLDRVCQRSFVRRAALVAWSVCALVSSSAAVSTWRHLAPWVNASPAGIQFATDSPNILVIVLDTLRFDRVGVYGSSNLTPNLDRLAGDSIVYTQAISTAPWTLPMHASLFTGLYASQHDVSWGRYELDESHPVIAALLKHRGYSTFAISNNWLLKRANGFARGFDEFLETPNDPHITGWRLAAKSALVKTLFGLMGLPRELGEDAGSAWTNSLIRPRLRAEIARKGPFFGFINYFEPHDPYHPPSAYLESHLTEPQRKAYRGFQQRQDDLCAHACGRNDTFAPHEIELMASLYDAEVAYQDEMVGELLATMKDLGLLQNTWIIVTSDHGELFGESNMVFHTAGAHFQLLHIPLIVRPPGGVAATIVDTPVQPVDIFHKLTEIAGAELPEGVTRSFPLPLNGQESQRRTLCISETFGASITGLYVTQYRNMQTDVTRWMRWITSVYADGHVLELDDRGPMALYDVRSDPRMENNLVDERGNLVEEYLNRYKAWSGRDDPGDSF